MSKACKNHKFLILGLLDFLFTRDSADLRTLIKLLTFLKENPPFIPEVDYPFLLDNFPMFELKIGEPI